MNDDEREPDSFAPRLRPPGPLHRGSDAFQLDTPESDVESNRAGWPGLDQLDVLSRRRQIDRLSRGRQCLFLTHLGRQLCVATIETMLDSCERRPVSQSSE